MAYPPPGVVKQWRVEWLKKEGDAPVTEDQYIAERAADWELESCIDVLGGQWEWDLLSQCTGWKEFRDKSEEILRAARRPKPPSLKELALEQLKSLEVAFLVTHGGNAKTESIRRALEQLDD
jgi:hypothetical protein